jgi:hypothetical protein
LLLVGQLDEFMIKNEQIAAPYSYVSMHHDSAIALMLPEPSPLRLSGRRQTRIPDLAPAAGRSTLSPCFVPLFCSGQ